MPETITHFEENGLTCDRALRTADRSVGSNILYQHTRWTKRDEQDSVIAEEERAIPRLGHLKTWEAGNEKAEAEEGVVGEGPSMET